MNLIRLASILFLFFITSCSIRDPKADLRPSDTHSLLSVAENCCMEPLSIATIDGNWNLYKGYTIEADGIIGISASRYTPFSPERVVAFYTPQSQINTRVRESNHLLASICINNEVLFSHQVPDSSNSLADLFGRTISFSIDGTSPLTRSPSTSSIYAPEIIRISFPSSVVSEQNPIPLCYYKDFFVSWNPDPNNTNGVLIVVKWGGIMSFGEDYPSTHVLHSICVTDNGKTYLDDSLFDEIPDGAFCSLWLLRGDVNHMCIDDTVYKLLAETHDMLNFILIRHITGN